MQRVLRSRVLHPLESIERPQENSRVIGHEVRRVCMLALVLSLFFNLLQLCLLTISHPSQRGFLFAIRSFCSLPSRQRQGGPGQPPAHCPHSAAQLPNPSPLPFCTQFPLSAKREAQPLQVHLFLDGGKKIIKIWTHVLNKVSGSFWNVPEKPDGRAREGRLLLLLASPARPSPLPAADPPAAVRCGPAAARPGTASERSGALSPRPCAPPRRAPPCPARGIPQHAALLGEMAN